LPGAVAELPDAGAGWGFGSQAEPLRRTELLLSLQGGRTSQADCGGGSH